MDRSVDARDVVLRVLRGAADAPEFLLAGGEAKRAFTVGRKGEWTVDAEGVADHHLWLAFNGETLYASTCNGESAMLGGDELGADWLEVAMPLELRFGKARIGISRRATQDEDTLVPRISSIHEEQEGRTSVHDAPTPVRHVDEEITRFDVERMNNALRRAQGASIVDEVTHYGPLEPPAPAPRIPRAATKGNTFVPPQHTLPPERETPLPLTPPPRPPPPPPLEPPPPPAFAAPPTPLAPSPQAPAAQPSAHAAVPSATGQRAVPPAPSRQSAAWPSLPPSAIGQMSSGRMSVAYQRPSVGFAPLTRSSAMPATMPSDELIVARRGTPRTGTIRVAIPASVTMATPGGYELPHRLPQSVPRATASGHQPVQSVIATAQRPRAPAGESGSAQRLITDFKSASTLTKIMGGLLLPVALLGLLAYARPAARSGPIPVATATTATASASASSASSAASITAVTPSVAASVASTPTPAPTATTARAAAAATARDLRTPERRALDAAASGDAVAAAEQYETLAAWHPDNLAYRDAARIFRARAKKN